MKKLPEDDLRVIARWAVGRRAWMTSVVIDRDDMEQDAVLYMLATGNVGFRQAANGIIEGYRRIFGRYGAKDVVTFDLLDTDAQGCDPTDPLIAAIDADAPVRHVTDEWRGWAVHHGAAYSRELDYGYMLPTEVLL